MSATARVGDLAEQVRGVSYSKEEAASAPARGYLPILRAGNITDEGLDFNDLVYVPASRVTKRQMIRRNDVLIAASSGSIDVVGKAARALNDYEGGFGAFCKVLRPRQHVDPAYFAHFFRTTVYRQRVSALAAGANINNLRNEDLDDLEIPVPPVSKQHRIADILDKADALRAKRRGSLVLLDGLRSSVLSEIEVSASVATWPTVSLTSCAETIQIGPFGSLLHEHDYIVGGTPLINPKHIKNGAIVPEPEVSVSDRKVGELSLYSLRAGDVILGRRGEMGRCAIVAAEHDGFICGTGSLFIRPKKSVMTSNFLAATLSSDAMRARLQSLALGVTLPNLNRTIVANLKILLPPISVQHGFDGRMEAIDTLGLSMESSLRQFDSAFAAIQHHAFRGN